MTRVTIENNVSPSKGGNEAINEAERTILNIINDDINPPAKLGRIE